MRSRLGIHPCPGTGSEVTARTEPTRRPRLLAGSTLLIGFTVFGLLWIVNSAWRQAYQGSHDDISVLADGLLLVPGARWQDWFTQGHAHFFDAYPEWPWGLTAFCRPAFQSLVYLAHFAFGRDWSSYLVLNYLGTAGASAIAFAIARLALRVGTGAALLAATLVLLSPAVLESSIWQVGYASEVLASVLVGCAFLATITRRDILCLVLLVAAVLTKETAVWAPLAAALTVLFRPARGDTTGRRAAVAAAMLLPVALWLGLRFGFYGGIGGTYATADYTPFARFLELTARKLVHLQNVLVSPSVFVAEGRWALVDRAIRIATTLLVLALLILWAVEGLRAAAGQLGLALRERTWPTADMALLVTLWAGIGLAFYLVLALPTPRYTASAVIFVWPAIVGEVERRREVAFQLGLVCCAIMSLGRTSHVMAELNPPSEQSPEARYFRAISAMNTVLRQTPPGIRQVYVLSAGLVTVKPDYLQAYLGMPASIVRVVDILWYCDRTQAIGAFDHRSTGGVVIIGATLPDCARFNFTYSQIGADRLVNGRIRRSDSISYELPDARWVTPEIPGEPRFEPGGRMIVNIRPEGPARFIVQEGGPESGITWFDTP